MSRITTIFLLLLLFTGMIFPAWAAEDLTEELVYRASLGRADDVQLLMKQGASPDSKNAQGTPALALAAARKDLEGLSVVQTLIANHADIEAHDSMGETALFYAAKQGNVPILNYLLAQHANASAVDVKGNQPRMVAYLAGQKDAVAALDDFATKQTETAGEQAKKQQDEKEKQELQAQLLKENAELKQTLAEKKSTEITSDQRKSARTLAFDTCAFQYWSYCSNQKQSTELKPEELEAAITSYQEQAESDKNELADVHKMPVPKVNDTITSAQTRIYNELVSMHSNIYRHEQGVGKHEDMKARCEKISTEWDAPVPEVAAPKNEAGGGGVGAAKSVPAAHQTSKQPASAAASLANKKPKNATATDDNQSPEKLRKISDDFVFNLHKNQQ